MSWEHDEYMYMVAKENSTTLPSTGLFIIRFHSIVSIFLLIMFWILYVKLCYEVGSVCPQSSKQNHYKSTTYNFAALHMEGAYTHFMNNEEDVENLKWLNLFKCVSVLTSVDLCICAHLIFTAFHIINL